MHSINIEPLHRKYNDVSIDTLYQKATKKARKTLQNVEFFVDFAFRNEKFEAFGLRSCHKVANSGKK